MRRGSVAGNEKGCNEGKLVYANAASFQSANREVEFDGEQVAPSIVQWDPQIYEAGSQLLPMFQDQSMKILQVVLVQAMEKKEYQVIRTWLKSGVHSGEALEAGCGS